MTPYVTEPVSEVVSDCKSEYYGDSQYNRRACCLLLGLIRTIALLKRLAFPLDQICRMLACRSGRAAYTQP